MKKKQPAEQQLVRDKNQITRDAMILSMRRLFASEDFKILRRQWINKRVEILDEGKKKPSELQWAKLDGFDTAVCEVEKWANMEIRDDKSKQKAATLSAILGGR